MVPEAPMPPRTSEGPHADEPVPPPADEVAKPLSSQAAETDELVPPQAFKRYPIELSMMPLYLDHTSRHIWDGEDRGMLKFINHGKNITSLPQPNDKWFQAALSLYGMKDLCKTNYITVNHEMLNAFVER
ncbi:unnamed protein product [Lathyrus oleraceus]